MWYIGNLAGFGSQQAAYIGFVCGLFHTHECLMYSGVSNDEHSDKWTISVEWTNCLPPTDRSIYTFRMFLHVPPRYGQPLTSRQQTNLPREFLWPHKSTSKNEQAEPHPDNCMFCVYICAHVRRTTKKVTFCSSSSKEVVYQLLCLCMLN